MKLALNNGYAFIALHLTTKKYYYQHMWGDSPTSSNITRSVRLWMHKDIIGRGIDGDDVFSSVGVLR